MMTNKKVEEAIEKTLIEKRIRELKTELQNFVDQANRNIAAYNASISELEALLNPPPIETEVKPNGESTP